jgi:hypothetical protein
MYEAIPQTFQQFTYGMSVNETRYKELSLAEVKSIYELG